MTKNIMSRYLETIHTKIINNYSDVSAEKLTHDTIFTYYYSYISSLNDMFESHKAILHEIYSA